VAADESHFVLGVGGIQYCDGVTIGYRYYSTSDVGRNMDACKE